VAELLLGVGQVVDVAVVLERLLQVARKLVQLAQQQVGLSQLI
jgi:hypothetical protein